MCCYIRTYKKGPPGTIYIYLYIFTVAVCFMIVDHVVISCYNAFDDCLPGCLMIVTCFLTCFTMCWRVLHVVDDVYNLWWRLSTTCLTIFQCFTSLTLCWTFFTNWLTMFFMFVNDCCKLLVMFKTVFDDGWPLCYDLFNFRWRCVITLFDDVYMCFDDVYHFVWRSLLTICWQCVSYIAAVN
jgi:hypothetical protein